MTSYIKILQKLDAFCTAHLQIKKFMGEFREQMPNFSTLNERYPIVFASPISDVEDLNTNQFTLEIYCVDIIQKDRANLNTIVSDCHLILKDLFIYYRDDNDADLDVVGTASISFVNNFDLDYVAGAVMTITFEVAGYGSCEIPMSPITPTHNDCEPATLIVRDSDNNVLYTLTVDSGATETQVIADSTYLVEYVNGTPIESGSILAEGSAVIQVPNPITCADATYTITDDSANVLHSGNIASGGSLNQSIADSTAVLKDTANATISTTSIKAEESEDIVAPDATVTNSNATYVNTVVSGGTLVLPDITVTDSDGSTFTQPSVEDVVCTLSPDTSLEVNGTPEGTFAAGSTIEVNVTDGVNPVTPNDVTVVGDVVTIEVPSGGACVDWDAENFITATGITDATQQGAIRTLVTDLKDADLWNKLQAIYPFVGGTATTHKFNLRNAQDSNGAFRLIFTGGWTHAATGVLPNGTNAYADTSFRPLQLIDNSSFHLMVNVRNINTGVSRIHAGAANSSLASFTALGRVVAGTIDVGGIAGQPSEYTPSVSIPPFVGSKIVVTNGSRNARYIANGVFQTNQVLQTQASPNANIVIGALNSAGTINLYDNCEFSFATMGLGLSDAEALDLHNIQLAFNTTLSR
jgi:hypothetical protein